MFVCECGWVWDRGDEGFDLSTSRRLCLGKQPSRNEPNDRLAGITPEKKALCILAFISTTTHFVNVFNKVI